MSSYLFRKDFSGGWQPGSDAVNCPNNGYLRGDNLQLDDNGILSVRRGAKKLISSTLASNVTVNTIFGGIYESSGTKKRYQGAFVNGNIYINSGAGSYLSVASGFDSSLELATTAAFGYVFASCGTDTVAGDGSKHKKLSPSTAYKWGIKAPTVKATVAAGAAGGITGTYRYVYVYYNSETSYAVSSGPSPLFASDGSEDITLADEKVTVTVTNPDNTVDPLVEEIWIYRQGNTLDQYYRVGVVTAHPYTGAPTTETFTDSIEDSVAIEQGLTLEFDGETYPPDNIIGLSEDYYTRIFALSYDGKVYPSKRVAPETFDRNQAISVFGSTEKGLWIKKAFGGLYVGTTRDIYRISGTGAEYDDGTIDLTLEPLNIGSPPVSTALAVEGDILIYMAKDGPRLLTGQESVPISGSTDLLWNGYSRHGVNAVNIKGYLGYNGLVNVSGTAVTLTWGSGFITTGEWSGMGIVIDGTNQVISSVTSDSTLTITNNLGTLSGKTYSIPASKFSMCMSNGILYVLVPEYPATNSSSIIYRYNIKRKEWSRQSYSIGGYAWYSLFADINGTIMAGDNNGFVWALDTGTSDNGTLISVTFTSKIDDDGKPLNRKDPQRLRIRADTGNVQCGVSTYVNGSGSADQSLNFTCNGETNADNSLTSGTTFTQMQLSITGTINTFKLFEYEVEYTEFPTQMWGRVLPTNGGTVAEKVISGIQLRACTLGASRTFTPYIDNSAGTTLAYTSASDVPEDFTIQFATPQTCKEIAWSVDGNIELYDWKPLVMYLNPAYRRLWDTGPFNGLESNVLKWIRGVRVKLASTSNIILTPYIDGTAQSTKTISVSGYSGVPMIYSVYFGREFKAHQPRFLLDAGSGNTFQPYWIEVLFRGSGNHTDKKARMVAPNE